MHVNAYECIFLVVNRKNRQNPILENNFEAVSNKQMKKLVDTTSIHFWFMEQSDFEGKKD